MLYGFPIRCSLTGERETSLPCPPYRRERARTHIHGTLGIIGPIPVNEGRVRLVFADLFDLVLLNLRAYPLRGRQPSWDGACSPSPRLCSHGRSVWSAPMPWTDRSFFCAEGHWADRSASCRRPMAQWTFPSWACGRISPESESLPSLRRIERGVDRSYSRRAGRVLTRV